VPLSAPDGAPRILLVRFSSIGDILLTTPLIRALRARHPDARIDMLTKPAFRPLLADNPHLDAVLAPEAGESLAGLAARLRPAHYTHKLDLHGSLRSGLLRLLLPRGWTGYSKRKLPRAILILTHRDFYPAGTPPVPERYFEAARGLDVRPDGGPPEFGLGAAAQDEAGALLAGAGVSVDAPLVALAPGAAHFTKRWPVEHWRALAAELAGGGKRIVVVGGPEDADTARQVAEAARGAVVAAGRLGLQGTGAMLKRSLVLVSGDTGVMHMATGVGTPVVALFGPTVEAFGFAPYRAPAEVLQRALPCRPCSRMGGPACPLGHHDCLRGLMPAQVLSAIQSLAAA